ncbi:MAG TPA: hypothetical protein VIZ22_04125 [Candidatus Limnocylindrales bacterium]
MVDWFRRAIARAPTPTAPSEPPGDEAPDDPDTEAVEPVTAGAEVIEELEGVSCPSCGTWLIPPPRSNRRCPQCREPIVVRRTEGRTVYFTEAAVAVFEAERQREADELRWTIERREWLRLARVAGAPEARRRRIDGRPPSAEAVGAAKALYLGAADAAVKEARRTKHWTDVGRLRREEAAALFAEAGHPVPPPDDIVALHREGAAAQLRAHAATGTHAELIGASCCKACRKDDGRAFKIADELRTPRLPHEDCPRGLCSCEWWMSVVAPPRRRRRRSATPAPSPAAIAPPSAADAPSPAADEPAPG